MARTYAYNDWGQATGVTGLKPWPPPITRWETGLSGSPPNEIQWRTAASLAVIFAATDIAGAAPFTIGYEIPKTLKCRLVKADQRLKKIPTPLIGYAWGGGGRERYGYLDDMEQYPGPLGCFTVSDYEYLVNNSDILVIGVPFSGYTREDWTMFEIDTDAEAAATDWGDGTPITYLSALSAMTGAGVELGLDSPGHTLIHDSTSAGIIAASVEAITAYAEVRNAHTIDVAWTVDTTGSMGGRQQTMKESAVGVTEALLEAGYNAWFSYTTHADWSVSDLQYLPEGIDSDGNYGDYGDDPYQVRFPFSALTEETQAAFAALDVDGQGGADGPETTLEALCRMYVARRSSSILAGRHLTGGVHMDPVADRARRGWSGSR